MKKIFLGVFAISLLYSCTANRQTIISENSGSFWLLTSIPEDFRMQPTPTAMGWNIIVNDTLLIKLEEPHNFENRGWWTFSNRTWTGEGYYYILYVPMIWNQSGNFSWNFREALIYSVESMVPNKVYINSNEIQFSLNEFKRLFEHSTTRRTESGFYIDFIEDKAWDQIQIPGMLRHNEPAGFVNRASFMGIDYDFALRIQNAINYSEIQQELDALVDERYRIVGNSLRKSINEYASSWDPIINEFYEIVYELTQHEWFYDNYIVVVSAFHLGLSNWHNNIVTRLHGDDPVNQRYITAFEIVLSHVFHISRKYFDEVEAPDHIIWAISEISAALILQDKRLLELWGDGYISRSNSLTGYQQLIELEAELITVYNSRLDFIDFLNNSIHLAKDMNRNFFMPIMY